VNVFGADRAEQRVELQAVYSFSLRPYAQRLCVLGGEKDWAQLWARLMGGYSILAAPLRRGFLCGLGGEPIGTGGGDLVPEEGLIHPKKNFQAGEALEVFFITLFVWNG
jgi:hypothetical protein